MAEDYEGQPSVAYHEAGHAVAAMRTSGRVQQINICDRAANDDDGFTRASHPESDEAFYIYAGAWAEAKHDRPTETTDLDRVLGYLRTNADDWTFFQRAAGHMVCDTEWMSMQHALASGGIMPPEYRPNWAWHERAEAVLIGAWDDGEIGELAERLLSHEREILLRNGQVLTRDTSRDEWNGSDYHDVADGQDGLVGPPPLIG